MRTDQHHRRKPTKSKFLACFNWTADLFEAISSVNVSARIISYKSVLSLLYSYFQVFIHNPHGRSQRGGRIEIGADRDISLLNINQSLSAVVAGQLDLSKQNDVLVIGTQTNLLAYDVENNSDIFYKDVSISCSFLD